MIRQYLQVKERYRDAVLFFRLGDFYEMFFEDAERAYKILDIALTSRNRIDETPVPLCGFPYHAATPYIGKLLGAGYKVAICEQVEDPKTAKGVVQREVVRVITPGTITEGEVLEACDNHFLVAVSREGKHYGLAIADVTTGEFRFTQCEDYPFMLDEIARVRPRELVFSEGDTNFHERLGDDLRDIHLSPVAEDYFSHSGVERLKSLQLWSSSEEAEWEVGIRAAGAIVSYIEENLPTALKVMSRLQRYRASQYLMIDETTRRNLELLCDFQGDRSGSLLAVLDRTLTSMGGRMLRQWILYPLLDERIIGRRQDGVEELREKYGERQNLRVILKDMQDLERLAGKAVAGSASPRDLAAVKESLRAMTSVREKMREYDSEIFVSIREQLCDLPEVVEFLQQAIVDDPPPSPREGGFIRTGFNAELDELRGVRSDAKGWIAHLERQERKRTGINSLKVRYNKVFGYYIEVPKSNLKLIPSDYIRKQTLVNGERYIIPELKEYESRILNSEDESLKLELALLAEVRDKVASHHPRMKQGSLAVATLDVLVALAEVAQSCHFSRPKVDSDLTISIREGRHPVVEARLGRGAFVPNDCRLDPDSDQIIILTGPNMAGKSTYMRQVALVVILAQIGSFVPAAEAHIGLVDRLFTRIGATDSLARGESTFMVEMNETARILRNASHRSLILLDEVGRGTSTFDGISIAWSVAEYLHDSPHHPRTLFATHYHELIDLALTKERVKNFNFAVKEWRGEVVFLRTLTAGASNRSYGIHVARLAGLPASVVDRAKEIFGSFEGGKLDEKGQPLLARGFIARDPPQLMLFTPPRNRFQEELSGLDVSGLTPVEALNVLHRLVEEAKEG
jgi:DNA mismatch repair protein MutS